MHKPILFITFFSVFVLAGQQNNVSNVRDGFLDIATDARAAGQGDIGVATSADAFSQFWNPSKYVFSEKIMELGYTQILAANFESNKLSQLSINFYKRLDDRSAYAFGVRTYAYTNNQFVESGVTQDPHEVAIDGSYTLRLSDKFAMSVAGRYISLKGKTPRIINIEPASGLYGIDVSGFYYGNEIAYKKFNGRLRIGFNFSNLRGKSLNDNTDIEIYAPSTLRAGAGFDFNFNQDNLLAITSEYKMLLDSYTENTSGEELEFGLEGSVIGLGLEYTSKERLVVRAGYSHGINRRRDSFVSLGTGLRWRYVDVDISFLLGVSEVENPIRNKTRISLSINFEELLLN